MEVSYVQEQGLRNIALEFLALSEELVVRVLKVAILQQEKEQPLGISFE
jgi:hypothetical protein